MAADLPPETERTDPAHPTPPPGPDEEFPTEFGDPGGAPAPEETMPDPDTAERNLST